MASVFPLWAILRVGPLPGERRLTIELVVAEGQDTIKQLADFIEMLSDPPVALMTVVVACVIVWRRMGWRSALLVMTASGVVMVNAALKEVLGPTGAYLELRGQAVDNYPSGHVSYAVAVFGAFAWLGLIAGQRELSVVAVILILVMGAARVARGAHVPSDVLGGYMLGSGWLLATIVAASFVQRGPDATVVRPKSAG